MKKLEGWELELALDDQLEEMRLIDSLPKGQPPPPPTSQEEYERFKAGVRPMRNILDVGEGLSEAGIFAARSTARVAAKAKKLTSRWRGSK